MSSENTIQALVHSLEEGAWAKKLRILIFPVFGLAMIAILLFDPMGWRLFKGLNHIKGMEQAAIGRELAHGNGFVSPVIRPMAVKQWNENIEGGFPQGPLPDTFHGPLWPATLAGVFKATGFGMEPDDINLSERIKPNQFIYTGDKAVAVAAVVLFYIAVVFNFLTVRRLFDSKIAWFIVVVTLLCRLFWEHAMSGLPQILVFLVLSVALWVLSGLVSLSPSDGRPFWLRLVLASFLFGLLALTHALTIWLFLGFLAFLLISYPKRFKVALISIGVFALVFAPWMVRNYQVSGSAVGLGWYSALHGAWGSESRVLAREEIVDSLRAARSLRSKVQSNLTRQVREAPFRLGSVLLAPLFFLALFHSFRREGTRRMRWLLLSMWVSAALGVAIWTTDDQFSPVRASDLEFLFIPLFAAYGLAFVFVLLGRTEIRMRYLRYSVIGLVLVLSILPMVNWLTIANRSPIQWPPYVPPYIAILGNWTKPNEIIVSDAPGAVGWYAGRRSLLLPSTLPRLIEMTDYNELKAPVAGIYLTPFTSNLGFLNEIIAGEYRDWAPVIMRQAQNIPTFPFKAMQPLPIRGAAVFYADWPRWSSEDRENVRAIEEEGLLEENDKKGAPKAEEKSSSE